MKAFDKPFTFDRVVRIVIGILIVGATLFLLDYLSSVLIPFIVAFIIAYMMNPFVNLLQRLVKKRIIAVLLALLIVLAVLVGIGWIIIPLIVSEFEHMAELLQKIASENNWQAQIEAYLPDSISEYIEKIIVNQDVQVFFESESLSQAGAFIVQKVLPELGGLFSETLNIILAILGLAIILLYLIFLLLDYKEITMDWRTLLPPKYKDRVLEILKDFEDAMHNYFRAQALIATIVGILFAIGFTIIGLPMGILLGLFIGMLNMIPYLQNIGLIPAVFFALMKSLETGTNFWVLMGLVLLVFLIVQTIQDGFLTPKIMGNATGLNAAVILLSLSIWGKMLGLLGLLIALPMTYLLLSYYRRYLLNRKINTSTEEKKSPGAPAKKTIDDKYRQ